MRVAQSSLFTPHPLGLLAVALATGIVVGHFIAFPFEALMVGGIGTFWLAILVMRRDKLIFAMVVLPAATIVGGATLETIATRIARTDQLKYLLDSGALALGDPVELTGTVNRPPELAPDGFYLTVRIEQARYKGNERKAAGTVVLLAPVRDQVVAKEYEQLELRYGARIRVMTALDRAESFRNPGVSSFTEYLERKGFDATGVIKSPLLVERLDDERVFLPLALLYEWRHALMTQINRTFSAETAGVLNAALLGNRYFLSHGAAERFRTGGTFHVLVISGLHISFIGGVVFLIMQRLTSRAALQFSVSVIILWGYALAVGAEASVVRAALMFTLVVLAPLVARRAQSLNILGGTALVLLVTQPENLFDPSFQLTFLSVLMIITLGWPLLQRMQAVGAWQPTAATPFPPSCAKWFRVLSEALFWSERKWRREMAQENFSYRLFKVPIAAQLERLQLQRLLRFAVGAIVISASVQLGLLPLLVLYFHRLSVSSLILNIGVGILMAALGLIALLALLLDQVSAGLAMPFVKLAQSVNWLMIHSVDLFARWGIASVRLPEYTGRASSIYALYFIPLVGLLFTLSRWNPLGPSSTEAGKKWNGPRGASLMSGVLALFLFLIILHPLSSGVASGYLRVDFLDVGQGDSALLTMPDGTTLLVDGGGRPSFNRSSPATSPDDEEAFARDTRSIGEAVVSEYLWWRGLDQVDYVLATHADADHIQGLSDVLRNFRVRGAIVAREPPDDAEFRQFAAAAENLGVPLDIIGAGDVLHFGAVRIETLWPAPIVNGAGPSRNNQSLVLRVRYGEKTLLLTGDIEKEAETSLVKGGVDLRSDLVKVPHHGSRTSSTDSFVNATHPCWR
ncbi:MAG: competence protein ComEC [Blastocatellia bacterium]|nr:competence protein ComEC [Blastocatellia bacterium]